MTNKEYVWTDNPTVSGVSKCDTDILNECLMHLKYENNNGDGMPLFYNFYSKEDMTTTGAYVNASLGSWLSGNIYPTAYDELVNKLGTGNVKASTDTYTDYDFVVNQGDMTFRLPIKNGQEIIFATGVKGDGKALGLTDGNTDYYLRNGTVGTSNSAVLTPGTSSTLGVGSSSVSLSANYGIGISTDSTKSGIILDTENITIPDGWNLYYKVANVITNQELLDVAYVTADLNTKISKTECSAYVVETYQNGESWYRVWSDGWCEQGGQVSTTKEQDVTITFLKVYNNVDYTVMRTNVNVSAGNTSYRQEGISSKTSSSFVFHVPALTVVTMWEAKGYIGE